MSFKKKCLVPALALALGLPACGSLPSHPSDDAETSALAEDQGGVETQRPPVNAPLPTREEFRAGAVVKDGRGQLDGGELARVYAQSKLSKRMTQSEFAREVQSQVDAQAKGQTAVAKRVVIVIIITRDKIIVVVRL